MAQFKNARIPSAFSSAADFDGQVPLLFQIVSPDMETLLLPEAIYLHINPSSLDFSYTKNIERFPTMGGYVEQHFGEELTEVSADQSTGAFVNVERGLTASKRRDTIAHRKMEQLFSIFENNGVVYDDRGQPQFRGRIRMIWGGGIYDGSFRSFDISEKAENPFQFSLSWDFTVEEEAHNLLF